MNCDLEEQYQQGLYGKLSGRDRRHCGLGFSEPPPEPLPARMFRTEEELQKAASEKAGEAEKLADNPESPSSEPQESQDKQFILEYPVSSATTEAESPKTEAESPKTEAESPKKAMKNSLKMAFVKSS